MTKTSVSSNKNVPLRQSDKVTPLQYRLWFNLTISKWNFLFQNHREYCRTGGKL